MFSVELDFQDGVSPPETILVRRPHAIIGSSEFAHAVIEGLPAGAADIRIVRGLGREFTCQPVGKSRTASGKIPFFEGAYRNDAEITLGAVRMHITAIDIDLQILPDESLDRAGVRVLRSAISGSSPLFPAVALTGSFTVFQSFPADHPLIVGRSRKCGLRLDASDVSREHARIGLDEDRFWVEDLGSTNGTKVNGARISGRRYLDQKDVLTIGAEFTLVPILSHDDVMRLNVRSSIRSENVAPEDRYPKLISFSNNIRPSSFVINGDSKISMGRDPANDIWIGASHVSRNHAEIYVNNDGGLEIIDNSSNGIAVDGERIPQGVGYELPHWVSTIDFFEGMQLTLCYSAEDEESARKDFSNRQKKVEPELDAMGTLQAPQISLGETQSAPAYIAENSADDSQEYREESEVLPEDRVEAGMEGENSVFHRMAMRKDNRARISSQDGRKPSGSVTRERPKIDVDPETEMLFEESTLLSRIRRVLLQLSVWLLLVSIIGAIFWFLLRKYF